MYWDVEGKKCCNQCFQHPWLREYIEGASTETGVCQYCGSPDGKLIEVSKLSDYFENVLTMFSPSNSDRGDPLVYLLQDQRAVSLCPCVSFESNGICGFSI